MRVSIFLTRSVPVTTGLRRGKRATDTFSIRGRCRRGRNVGLTTIDGDDENARNVQTNDGNEGEPNSVPGSTIDEGWANNSTPWCNVCD